MKPPLISRVTIIAGAGALLISAWPALADGDPHRKKTTGAESASGTMVYVPQGGTNSILVIDASNDKIVGTIPGLELTHGLAATHDGRFLIAGAYTETTAEKTPAPPKPAGVSEDEHAAHHAKPQTPAAGRGGAVSYVSIVRVGDKSIERRITVPGAVHHVAVTPDDRHAILTHPGNDGVSVIDLSSNTVIRVVLTGPLPNYAAVHADGTRVYVSNAGNNTVSEIDTRNWIVTRNILVGKSPEHLVLSRDGNRLFVNNVDDGTVSQVSTKTGAVEQTFTIGGEIHGIDLSDDGATLNIAAREKNRIFAIDLKSGGMRSASLAPEPYHLTTVRGTGKIYVSSADEPKIWVIDQKSLKPIATIPISGKGHQMAISGS